MSDRKIHIQDLISQSKETTVETINGVMVQSSPTVWVDYRDIKVFDHEHLPSLYCKTEPIAFMTKLDPWSHQVNPINGLSMMNKTDRAKLVVLTSWTDTLGKLSHEVLMVLIDGQWYRIDGVMGWHDMIKATLNRHLRDRLVYIQNDPDYPWIPNELSSEGYEDLVLVRLDKEGNVIEDEGLQLSEVRNFLSGVRLLPKEWIKTKRAGLFHKTFFNGWLYE